MTLRHVVVEGVDGSGKSTLMKELAQMEYPRFTPSEKRSSSSLGGPVPKLDKWVEDQARMMPYLSPTLYDRHPVISEPIYGPICRKGVPGRFNISTWLEMYRNHLARHALVIWCSPPFPVVYDNVRDSAQMSGVRDHIDLLYHEYNKQAKLWPGVQIRYDYTRRNALPTLLGHIRNLFKGN